MTIVRALQPIAILSLLLTTLSAAAAPTRIAFLNKGEVWILAADRGAPRRQTRTGGKVEDFRFSPRGDYFAYAKRLRPGDGRWICSIVIVNATTGAVIKEIQPVDGWIDIDKWLGTTLVYHASAAMEVSGVFEFDAIHRTGHELDPNAGSQALDSDMAPDGSLLAYVDNIGLGPTFEERLHLVDMVTGADAVQVSKRSLMAPAIAPAKDAVTFVEVFGEGANARDRVWVYRRDDQSVVMINDDTVKPKSGGNGGLAWSPDNRYVLVTFGGTLTVLDVAGTSPPRTFPGAGACWSGADTVVVARASGLDAINVVSGFRQRLVASGEDPQCFDALGH
jgi:hypothetical protein